MLPATVALLILAGPLTVVIFHYGKFDEQDVHMSTLALMAYSIGPVISVYSGGCASVTSMPNRVMSVISPWGTDIGLA